MMEYKFLHGLFRFNWHALPLKDNWKHLSFHYGNSKTEHYFNLHLAYRFQFPFIKLGFDNIWKFIK